MIRVVLGENLGIDVDLVGLVQGLSVDVDLLVLDLERLAFQADDALDVVPIQFPGILEDDDVLPLDPLPGQEDGFRGG